MTTTNPPDRDPTDVLKALIEAFTKLPPFLSYGGLILIAAIVIAWLTGELPEILLAIPAIVIAAFLVYAYLNNRHEMDKERLRAQQESEKRRLEAELERYKLQQHGDLERARLEQQVEMKKIEAAQAAPVLTPPKVDEPPVKAAVSWPDSYLRYVWQNCFQLHMTSIDPRAQELGASVLNLHSVFTTLDVPAVLDKEEALRQRERLSRRDAERREREPALAALSRPENRYMVLLGQPGSGKSTLVRFLALCLSGASLREKETNLESLASRGWGLSDSLPILVVLRDYAAKGLSKKQALWTFIAGELKDNGLFDIVTPLSEHLKRQGGILLLDGLDEVSEAHQRREQLRQAILQFVREFPSMRIVVTSRPYAYQDPNWQLPNFRQTTLLDFTPEQIETYIDRWYAVAAPQDPNLGEERARQYAENLKAQVQRNQNLQELAPRPLLLALMVSLHRWRGGGLLPERREQLYDASVNLLLDLWQRPKTILDDEGRPTQESSALTELGIDTTALRRALSQLAFEVHRDQPDAEGTADIDHEKLVAALRQAVPKEKRDAILHQKIAQYVRDRAGLLEDRGEGVYGFPHRTFQEYLAAMHLLDREDFPQNIVSLARYDPARWREATLLAGNSANTNNQWLLVEHLYERRDPPKNERPVEEAQWWGVYLAGQVLHDSDLLAKETELYRNSLQQVKEWHKAVLGRGALPPRDRAKVGILLAKLGDNRPGVGVVEKEGILIPDIVWGEEVPAGRYEIGGDEEAYQSFDKRTVDIKRPYRLAKYLITTIQFQCFIDAPDRDSPQWQRGIPSDEKEFSKPYFPFDNHPRENVSWYQAIAFCRWLSDKVGYVVDLPHEYEWEAAARYPDGRFYPWGNDFEGEKANTIEGGIGQTTAVGMYPSGRNPTLDLYDLSGNVFEWQRNAYEKPDEAWLDKDAVDGSSDRRVLRGGAWSSDRNVARAAGRFSNHPDYRGNDVGFRVAVRRPPSHLER